MSLYNLQLQRLDLMAEHERKLAELEYVVGGPLVMEREETGGEETVEATSATQ
jgi:hypothetical protein